MKELLIYLTCFLPLLATAQQFPDKPKQLVSDYTNTLSAGEIASLEQKLVAFNDSTSTQISVVLINSLEGYDIADYAVRLAEKWGIGRKQKDNGVLLLASIQERRVTIQVGYGLEGVITDALSRRIIEQQIKPSFNQGKYSEGLDRATTVLMKLSTGEYTAEPNEQGSKKDIPKWPLMLALIIFVFLMRMRRRHQYIGTRSGGGGVPAWPFFMGGSGRGSWGDFSSGSGGFGGFGGGSFGGGGASGSW